MVLCTVSGHGTPWRRFWRSSLQQQFWRTQVSYALQERHVTMHTMGLIYRMRMGATHSAFCEATQLLCLLTLK